MLQCIMWLRLYRTKVSSSVKVALLMYCSVLFATLDQAGRQIPCPKIRPRQIFAPLFPNDQSQGSQLWQSWHRSRQIRGTSTQQEQKIPQPKLGFPQRLEIQNENGHGKVINMKNCQKSMDFCDQSWNSFLRLCQVCPEFYQI